MKAIALVGSDEREEVVHLIVAVPSTFTDGDLASLNAELEARNSNIRAVEAELKQVYTYKQIESLAFRIAGVE